MTKEHILQEIRRTAEANGGAPLGIWRFLKETGIKDSDWIGKYWARWGDAIREAGLIPNQMQVAYEDSALLEKFAGLVLELGKIPVKGELLLKARSDPTFPNEKTFSRFGSKPEIVKRLAKYCEGRSGHEEVTRLCQEYQSRAGEKTAENLPGEETVGFVYLIKSGRNYKVGRSNSAGRREYELAIQLPEKAIKVHEIRTDDPVGIEEYWHKRFQAKRKNGEWFDLNAADISAFKRRKFM